LTRFHFERPDGPPNNNAQNILIHLNEFIPPQGIGSIFPPITGDSMGYEDLDIMGYEDGNTMGYEI